VEKNEAEMKLGKIVSLYDSTKVLTPPTMSSTRRGLNVEQKSVFCK